MTQTKTDLVTLCDEVKQWCESLDQNTEKNRIKDNALQAAEVAVEGLSNMENLLDSLSTSLQKHIDELSCEVQALRDSTLVQLRQESDLKLSQLEERCSDVELNFCRLSERFDSTVEKALQASAAMPRPTPPRPMPQRESFASARQSDALRRSSSPPISRTLSPGAGTRNLSQTTASRLIPPLPLHPMQNSCSVPALPPAVSPAPSPAGGLPGLSPTALGRHKPLSPADAKAGWPVQLTGSQSMLVLPTRSGATPSASRLSRKGSPMQLGQFGSSVVTPALRLSFGAASNPDVMIDDIAHQDTFAKLSQPPVARNALFPQSPQPGSRFCGGELGPPVPPSPKPVSSDFARTLECC